jgi:hypothetical protein
MKDAPKHIFLQVGPDVPSDVSFSDLEIGETGVSWASTRIWDTDIEYILLTNKVKKTLTSAERKEINSQT